MNTWHLTFNTEGLNPLVFTESQRRRIVRALARVVGHRAVLFCVVDNHLHLVVLCKPGDLGRITAGIYHSLATFIPAIRTAAPTLVNSRQHLRSLVPYVLTQVLHHKVGGAHPALWSGSCFQDLIGARLLDPLQLQIATALPRFDLSQACQAVGLASDQLVLLQADEVRRLGASRIVSATSAALCVGPALGGNVPSTVRARRAAVQLGLRAGVAPAEIVWVLGITPRAARRLAGQPTDTAAVRATATRLSLEAAVSPHAGDSA